MYQAPTFSVWSVKGHPANEMLKEHLALLNVEYTWNLLRQEDAKAEALVKLPMVYADLLFLGGVEEFMSIPPATIQRIDRCCQCGRN